MQRPKFTKRHFDDIAAVLKILQPDTAEDRAEWEALYGLWYRVRENLINLFESENPGFNRERFIKATEE